MDVTNAFNYASCVTVFCEFELVGGPLAQVMPFVRCFYGGSFLLFYRAGGDDLGLHVLASASSTRQGDPLGGGLFAVAHLQALRATAAARLALRETG